VTIGGGGNGLVMWQVWGEMRFFLTGLRFSLSWLRFFRALSSVVRQMLGLNSQRRGTARTHPHLLLFVLFGCYFCCSMYCLCVNVYCHRMTTQFQLINMSYIVSYTVIWCGKMWRNEVIS